MAATIAERQSLSPTAISWVATVSFSFTTGITPIFNSSSKVFLALYRLRSFNIVNFVSNICAVVWLYSENNFWYIVISRDCPTAAHACFSAIDRFFSCRPVFFLPTAMAPEETKMTSFPWLWISDRIRTSRSSLYRLIPPVFLCVSEDEPIFTTIRFLSFSIFRYSFITVSSFIMSISVFLSSVFLFSQSHIFYIITHIHVNGQYFDAMASYTRIPSMAADVMPPAYPAPSPQG